MPEVRSRIPKVEPGDLFPKAQSKPMGLMGAIQGLPSEWGGDIRRYAIGAEWAKLKIGEKSTKYLSLVKPKLDKPCPTLTKGAGEWPSGASVVHPLECRKFSVDEQKRIASFPDSFNFQGTWGEATSRIGNSVPPLFMHAISAQIRHVVFGGPALEESRMKTDYPAHLEMMWQKAIAPRGANAPTVISTFAGGGGSSTGYMMAGYRELLAVEWDDNAVQTLRLNYPHLDIYHGDIAKLTVEEVLQRTGLQVGELDVFDGSPPCQGFSTAGKRDFDDDRNQLFREYVRLLRGLQPKVFVMENVSGMVKGKMKLIFAEILTELKASGYRVSARLLNAMYFHVPQSRERMIFIGVRDDLGIEPSHPKAESKPMGVCLDKKHDIDLVLSADSFNKIDAHKKRQKAKGNGFSWQEVTSEKPSLAIVKNMAIVGANTRLVRCEDGWRFLSDKEIKQIGGYPYAFLFADRESMIERIGNSVPPLFMEAIARNIRTQILSKVAGSVDIVTERTQ